MLTWISMVEYMYEYIGIDACDMCHANMTRKVWLMFWIACGLFGFIEKLSKVQKKKTVALTLLAWRLAARGELLGDRGQTEAIGIAWRLTARVVPLGDYTVAPVDSTEQCALLIYVLRVCDVGLGPRDACLCHEREVRRVGLRVGRFVKAGPRAGYSSSTSSSDHPKLIAKEGNPYGPIRTGHNQHTHTDNTHQHELNSRVPHVHPSSRAQLEGCHSKLNSRNVTCLTPIPSSTQGICSELNSRNPTIPPLKYHQKPCRSRLQNPTTRTYTNQIA
ncbi:hypothetical protein DEO72_LG5g1074 [Vigna unguiculata]|uniref:Uncharacterized protein n=1 Tax=Vigna unguiculata TaxID=3917 RepID=A0A4D6LYQ8_VIGUN|nr:hypothetical protein DEO72_LG5g1074 [Vigna unguiculata]